MTRRDNHGRRLSRAALVLAAAVVLAGASSAAGTLEAAAPSVRVEKRGFAVGSEGTEFGAVLRNPTARDARALAVTLTLVGPNGGSLETERRTVAVIPARKRYYLGGSFEARAPRGARLTVAVGARTWTRASARLPAVVAKRVYRDADGSTAVDVTIRNPLTTTAKATTVGVVAFDRPGKVIGGSGVAGYVGGPIAPREEFEFGLWLYSAPRARVSRVEVSTDLEPCEGAACGLPAVAPRRR